MSDPLGERDELAHDIAALRPALYAFALKLCRTHYNRFEDADDLTQRSLERALKKRHTFEDDTNLRGWLFSVMQTTAIDQIREDERRPRLIAGDGGVHLLLAPDDPSIGLTIRDLDRAFDRLSPDQKAAIVLVGIEQRSFREAAELLAVPIGTVLSRSSRARDRLRRNMNGEFARESTDHAHPGANQGTQRPRQPDLDLSKSAGRRPAPVRHSR